MQEIKDDIKAIGTISTWLLGFLALVIAALTSFIFQDLTALIIEYNFPALKHAVLALLGAYIIIACGILYGLVLSFASPSDEEKVLKKKLKRLQFIFKMNIVFGVISLFAVLGFVSYFLYG